METPSFVLFVEEAAQFRKEPPVERIFIIKALEKIESGEEDVKRYPMGSPTMKGVYDLAARLQEEFSSKNKQ
jgi:hypothetical protein